MAPVAPLSIVEQLQWRYATKKFDQSRTIPTPAWQALEEVLVLTPSSYGLQPWRFIVITNPEIKEQLLPHSWGQRQVVDASHLVVFAIKSRLAVEDIERYLDRIAEVRGVPLESLSGFRRMLLANLITPATPFDLKEWATRQVYIALGNFMTSAAAMGIDTCPMEGIVPGKYDQILDLEPLGLSTVVACPAGYRMPDDKTAAIPKVRFPLEDVIVRRP